jgi:hypothetical protein
MILTKKYCVSFSVFDVIKWEIEKHIKLVTIYNKQNNTLTLRFTMQRAVIVFPSCPRDLQEPTLFNPLSIPHKRPAQS